MVQFIFYLFATVLIFAAVRVITVKNPVHAALHLVLAFFSMAAIWLLLEAEFLAIALVLVYVGAVMVLFLFVVMMLDINVATVSEGFTRYLSSGFLVGLLILLEMVAVVGSHHFGLKAMPAPTPMAADAVVNTVLLGNVLYTEYVYPFELAAIILLVAMVAAIALVMRPKRWSKYVKPEDQVVVKAQDRLTMVKMTAEKES
jgi:NADH-quinone oxidoreductase subunit J